MRTTTPTTEADAQALTARAARRAALEETAILAALASREAAEHHAHRRAQATAALNRSIALALADRALGDWRARADAALNDYWHDRSASA